MTKVCKKCGKEKDLSDFHKELGGKYGHKSQCKTCETARMQAYRQTPKGKYNDKNASLKRDFGITLGQYEQMFAKQNGCCAVCGKTPSGYKRAFAVDHNHETGEIRGLLCGWCNKALGLLRDSPELLRQAANYLEKHNHHN